MILPRETADASRFFGDIEKRSLEFRNFQPRENDEELNTTETNQYQLGCFALCKDIAGKARDCPLNCLSVWNAIDTELHSDRTLAVTTLSGEAGDIPARLKVEARLPLLSQSQAPNNVDDESDSSSSS
jgi:hypothetical protein